MGQVNKPGTAGTIAPGQLVRWNDLPEQCIARDPDGDIVRKYSRAYAQEHDGVDVYGHWIGLTRYSTTSALKWQDDQYDSLEGVGVWDHWGDKFRRQGNSTCTVLMVNVPDDVSSDDAGIMYERGQTDLRPTPTPTPTLAPVKSTSAILSWMDVPVGAVVLASDGDIAMRQHPRGPTKAEGRWIGYNSPGAFEPGAWSTPIPTWQWQSYNTRAAIVLAILNVPPADSASLETDGALAETIKHAITPHMIAKAVLRLADHPGAFDRVRNEMATRARKILEAPDPAAAPVPAAPKSGTIVGTVVKWADVPNNSVVLSENGGLAFREGVAGKWLSYHANLLEPSAWLEPEGIWEWCRGCSETWSNFTNADAKKGTAYVLALLPAEATRSDLRAAVTPEMIARACLSFLGDEHTAAHVRAREYLNKLGAATTVPPTRTVKVGDVVSYKGGLPTRALIQVDDGDVAHLLSDGQMRWIGVGGCGTRKIDNWSLRLSSTSENLRTLDSPERWASELRSCKVLALDVPDAATVEQMREMARAQSPALFPRAGSKPGDVVVYGNLPRGVVVEDADGDIAHLLSDGKRVRWLGIKRTGTTLPEKWNTDTVPWTVEDQSRALARCTVLMVNVPDDASADQLRALRIKQLTTAQLAAAHDAGFALPAAVARPDDHAVGDVVSYEDLPRGALVIDSDGEVAHLWSDGETVHWIGCAISSTWTLAASKQFAANYSTSALRRCTVLAINVPDDATVEQMRELVNRQAAPSGPVQVGDIVPWAAVPRRALALLTWSDGTTSVEFRSDHDTITIARGRGQSRSDVALSVSYDSGYVWTRASKSSGAAETLKILVLDVRKDLSGSQLGELINGYNVPPSLERVRTDLGA